MKFGSENDNTGRIKEILSGLDDSDDIHTVCTNQRGRLLNMAKKNKLPLHDGVKNTMSSDNPIEKAMRRGDTKAVQAMVECGFNPDGIINDDKQVLLHVAAATGNTALCAFLCSIKKADIFKVNVQGRTPAFLALESNNMDALSVLISNCGKDKLYELFSKLTKSKNFCKSCLVMLNQFLEQGMVLTAIDRQTILAQIIELGSVYNWVTAKNRLHEKDVKIIFDTMDQPKKKFWSNLGSNARDKCTELKNMGTHFVKHFSFVR